MYQDFSSFIKNLALPVLSNGRLLKKSYTVKLNHWRMKLVQNDNSIELTFRKSEWTFQKHGLQLIVVKSPYFVEQKVYILQETSGHKVQVVSKIWKHIHKGT